MPKTLRAGRYPAPAYPSKQVRSAARVLCRVVLRGVFRLEYQGQHHVPRSGPALMIGNHPSYFDPWLIGFGTRRWITWMAWTDAFAWPGIGWLMKRTGTFGVDMHNPGMGSLRTCYEILAQRRVLGIFFEGERSHSFGLNEPKTGTARIALRSGVPVIPVAISGIRRLWPKDAAFPKPGKVLVRFHPPIDTVAFRPELSAREREQALTDEVANTIRACLPGDGRYRDWSDGP
jgi:1-acyl-sn-glycerol-3-phosphate acyltransferase